MKKGFYKIKANNLQEFKRIKNAFFRRNKGCPYSNMKVGLLRKSERCIYIFIYEYEGRPNSCLITQSRSYTYFQRHENIEISINKYCKDKVLL